VERGRSSEEDQDRNWELKERFKKEGREGKHETEPFSEEEISLEEGRPGTSAYMGLHLKGLPEGKRVGPGRAYGRRDRPQLFTDDTGETQTEATGGKGAVCGLRDSSRKRKKGRPK